MRRSVIIIKIAGIVLFALAFAFLVLKGYYFTAIFTGAGILLLALSLYADQYKSMQRMERLIAHIHYGDLNMSFPASAQSGSEEKLVIAMNEALTAFRERLYYSVATEAEMDAWQKLIRVLTHEIMNSIAPIISLSETMTERAPEGKPDEKEYELMRQAMQTIHRRSKGLLDFVENYRKLTRIPTPVMQSFSVSTLLQDVVGLFSPDAVCFTTEVRPENLPLYADRSLVEQVLVNLLKNATEACKEVEQPCIQLKATRRNEDVEITITDNGPGILPEAQDKVFVPFFTTKQGGSGIGLSICRQIMNRHNGTIHVSSKEGEGTTFTLHFGHQETLTRR